MAALYILRLPPARAIGGRFKNPRSFKPEIKKLMIKGRSRKEIRKLLKIPEGKLNRIIDLFDKYDKDEIRKGRQQLKEEQTSDREHTILLPTRKNPSKRKRKNRKLIGKEKLKKKMQNKRSSKTVHIRVGKRFSLRKHK